MTKENYLLKLKQEDSARIRDTWYALGSLWCNNNTKMYVKDTLFRISQEDSPLKDSYIFAKNTYTVDNKKFPPIDWTFCDVDTIESKVITYQGVVTPFFRVIATADEMAMEASNPIDESYVPFDGFKTSDDVQIDDDELVTLLGEVGCPFIDISELEYDRDTICRTMIRPALDVYYGLFPIVEEQAIGQFAPNQEYMIPFPKNAHGAILYYTLGTPGTAGSNTQMSTAFAFNREQIMYGGAFGAGGAGRWGNGVRYYKNVPGFTGMHSGMPGSSGVQQMIDANAAAQGVTNYFRREKYTRKKIDGVLYAYGYSTVGGFLNAKWLEHSYDWNDIRYELIDQVRSLCKAYIMRNLGSLRSMVKSDIPGQIDYSYYQSRADKLESEVKDELKKQPYMLGLGGMARGGL